MKTQLSVLFVSAMIIASAGVAPSFAQVMEPITISTDKESYSDGDTIVISGEVRERLSGVPVSLRVIAANGNLVAVQQIDVGADRKFSIELVAGGGLWSSSGEYTVNVQYGSQQRVAETAFDFGGSSGPAPGPDPGSSMSVDSTFSVDAGDAGSFDVGYAITGGSIENIAVDGETSSLIVTIDATDDGELVLTLPRDVIDARMGGCEGADDVFYVLVDAEEVDFAETKTSGERTLTIGFVAGSSEIEIIGTCAIPEFGAVAALVLAAAIVSIIAVSARSRLSIMPRY